jgi:hypothetical protein
LMGSYTLFDDMYVKLCDDEGHDLPNQSQYWNGPVYLNQGADADATYAPTMSEL